VQSLFHVSLLIFIAGALSSGCALLDRFSKTPAKAESAVAIPAKTAAGLPAPVESGASPAMSARELPYLINVVQASKRCLELLGERDSSSLVTAATGVEAARKRLEQIDTQTPINDKVWAWTPAVRQETGEVESVEIVYLPDAPIANASAIGLRCKKKKGVLKSIQVIGANGVSWEFPVNRVFSGRKDTTHTCYLYYPANVSKIALRFAEPKDARAQVDVSIGVTALPEYAKHADFYYKWVLREIENGNPDQAATYLKRAIARVYHFRISRKIM